MKDKILSNMKWVIVAVLFILSFLCDRYWQDIFVMTFLWVGLGCAWNLNCGYSRRLSIGHSAFVGIGAYTSTILFMTYGVSPWVGMVAGMLISGMVAFVLGKATLGLKGTFFTLTTIAFAEIVRIFTVSARDVTGGSLGLLLPYKPGLLNMSWNDKEPFLLICGIYMIALLLASTKMERSKFGYYLVAIGEDRQAAETLGVNSKDIMTKSFIISAVTTSMGGTLLAQYILFIDPHSVMGMTTISLQFVLICIIGGMGTAFGPFVGAVILIPLSTLLRGYLSEIGGMHGFLYGVILLAVVLFKPEGLAGPIGRSYKRLFKLQGGGGK